MNRKNINRRQFLKASLMASLGSSSLWSTMTQLQTVNAATTFGDFSDYKALVCVFLSGGNDSANMIIPVESNAHAVYSRSRGQLAVPLSQLTPLGNSGYGVPPSSAAFAQLYSEGKLAVLANTGPLIEPVTRAQILAASASLPPQLHSHNDQQKLWMLGDSSGRTTTGWAGRIADLLETSGIATAPALNLNFGRNEVLQMGQRAQAFSLDSKGDGVSRLHTEGTYRVKHNHAPYLDLMAQSLASAHPMVRQYASAQQRSLENNRMVADALASTPAPTSEFTTVSGSRLAEHLRATAHVIAARSQLGSQRQIFFINTGSWDTHANQVERHNSLQETLTTSLSAFQLALEELGVSESVTTFTASEFGRTLSSNGDGSDHGWGGHSFILGGAVHGGQIYGTMPNLELDSEDDVGKGRLIPTTSTEQYTATLARWFGLSDVELSDLLPNLNRFDSSNLGFMA